jgi:hypothetical protein
MRAVLIAALLGSAGIVRAAPVKRAPAAAPVAAAAPAAAAAAAPVAAPAAPVQPAPDDQAKLRAILQRIQERSEHFDFGDMPDAAVVAPRSQPVPDERAAPAPADPSQLGATQLGDARGRRRGPGPNDEGIPINGALRSVGVEPGAVDVSIRGKGVGFKIHF